MRQQTSNFRSCYPSLPCTSPEKTASGPTKKKKTTNHRDSFFRSTESFFRRLVRMEPLCMGSKHTLQSPIDLARPRRKESSLFTALRTDQRPDSTPIGWSEGGVWFPPPFLKCGKIFCQLGLFCKLVNFFVQCALGDKGNLWNHPALGYNNYMFTNCQGEAVCCYSLGTWQRQFPHRQGACCD